MEKSKLILDFKNETEPDVRRSAAIALTELDRTDEEIICVLAGGVRDTNRGVRDVCTRALSNPPEGLGSMYAGYVSPLIENNNIETRNLASEILRQIGEISISAILPYAKHPDEDVRQFAVEILGGIAGSEAIDIIIELLHDENINVRNAAIEALGNIKADEAVEILIQIYEPDLELRPMIIEALGKIGNVYAEQFLIELLKNEEDLFLKTACIDALAFIGRDIDICHNLMGELPEALTEIQPIILKAIYAIAFRQELDIKLPDELRYVAYNSISEDDTDIRIAGLVALGSSYIQADVDALVKEAVRHSEETQFLLLSNLVINSAPDVITEFFKRYSMNHGHEKEPADFISNIINIWNETPPENNFALIDTIVRLVFDKNSDFTTDILETFFELDADVVINTMLDIIPDANFSQIDMMIEITRRFARFELVPVLETLTLLSNSINERARILLEELTN